MFLARTEIQNPQAEACATEPQIHEAPVSKKEALASQEGGVYTSNSEVSRQRTPGTSAAKFQGIFTAHFLQKFQPMRRFQCHFF
jgi:hypothetical protein